MGAWGRMSIQLNLTGVVLQNRTYDGTQIVTYAPSTSIAITGFSPVTDAAYLNLPNPASLVISQISSPNASVTPYSVSVSIPITFNAAGIALGLNTKYNSNATGTFSVTISKAPLAITAGNDTKTYGDPDPTFTYTPSGLVPGETIASIGATVSFTRAAGTAVGSYTITPSISPTPSNYTVSLYTGLLSIITKGVTINTPSLAGISKTYNGTPDATTNNAVTLSGVIPADVSLVSAVVSNATFALSFVGNGIQITADLGITGAQAGNYSATPTNITTLSANITKAPLSVTGLSANSKTADGTTTLTTSGTATLVGPTFGGDTPSVASVSAAFPSSDVGCYSITGTVTLDGSGNANYSASADLGTACITGAPEPPQAPIPVINSEHGNSNVINNSKANAFVAAFQTPVAAGAPPRKPASASDYTAGLKAINASRFIR
jgi:hypothetical protein